MDTKDAWIHPTAEVHPKAVIGKGVQIWNWTKIREGVRIEAGCSIGQGVYIDYGVILGPACKIQNGVNLYHGVKVGAKVFVGPNVTFTNDLYPRAHGTAWTVVPTHVEDGVSIGANATIVCGVTLGKHCMVAAGAVVNQNVPPHGLVIGQPAKLVDYVNTQGRRINHDMAGALPDPRLLNTDLLIPRGALTVNPKSKIRVGVVGVGPMGRHHLRIYDFLKGTEVVAVVDTDRRRASEAAIQYDCKAYGGVEDLVGLVDAVSIATPIETHAAIGSFLMDNGIHCLVEKPLAGTEEDCLALVRAAERNRVILLVGHMERFNPALQELTEILSRGGQVYAMDTRRMSAAIPQGSDVDVVSDLMTHDLDIVLSLKNVPVTDVVSKHVRTSDAKGKDYVTAMLSFDDGTLANLTASRITQNKVRALQLTTELGFITLNYTTQELLIYRQGTGQVRTRAGSQSQYSLDLSIERVLVRNAEPLILELQHFMDAVRGKTSPLITGAHAHKVMQLVWSIRDGTFS